MIKKCSRCKKKKEISHFSRNRSKADGHDEYCKKCRNSYLINRRKENPEYRETVRKANRSYRDSNKDVLLQRSRKRYKEGYRPPSHLRMTTEDRKKKNLRTKYGIQWDQYQRMLEEQEHRCAICNDLMVGRHLHVDHDHELKKVRGLLCQQCNLGLGNFKDSAELLRSAITYLGKR